MSVARTDGLAALLALVLCGCGGGGEAGGDSSAGGGGRGGAEGGAGGTTAAGGDGALAIEIPDSLTVDELGETFDRLREQFRDAMGFEDPEDLPADLAAKLKRTADGSQAAARKLLAGARKLAESPEITSSEKRRVQKDIKKIEEFVERSREDVAEFAVQYTEEVLDGEEGFERETALELFEAFESDILRFGGGEARQELPVVKKVLADEGLLRARLASEEYEQRWYEVTSGLQGLLRDPGAATVDSILRSAELYRKGFEESLPYLELRGRGRRLDAKKAEVQQNLAELERFLPIFREKLPQYAFLRLPLFRPPAVSGKPTAPVTKEEVAAGLEVLRKTDARLFNTRELQDAEGKDMFESTLGRILGSAVSSAMNDLGHNVERSGFQITRAAVEGLPFQVLVSASRTGYRPREMLGEPDSTLPNGRLVYKSLARRESDNEASDVHFRKVSYGGESFYAPSSPPRSR